MVWSRQYLASATFGASTTTYTYDGFGRLTNESSPAGSVTYSWDSVGHLVQVASAESTSTYSYGATGMRERAVVASSSGTTTVESVWAGMQLAAQRVDAGGVTTTYRFLYGPGGLPLECVVETGGTSVSYAYQCDRAGSVIGMTDAAGTLVASYRYDPWGTVVATGGSNSALAHQNPLRYRGYCYDEASSLYYLPARYYDPATARFISQDPAAPEAGDPLTLNRYAYCVGDPVNYSDSTGARHECGGGGGDVFQFAVEMARNGELEEAKALQAAVRGRLAFDRALEWGCQPQREWDPQRYDLWVADATGFGLSIELAALGYHGSVQAGFVSNYNQGSPLVAASFGKSATGRISGSLSPYVARYGTSELKALGGKGASLGVDASLPRPVPLAAGATLMFSEEGDRLVYAGSQQQLGLNLNPVSGPDINGHADVTWTGVLWDQ